jgi:dolichyl-phosphate-mannose--protein O-mannosyl transferase
MSVLSILQSWANWAPVVLVRDSKYGMPAIQSLHLMGLTVFLATTLALDLRLAGVGLKDLSLALLARQLKPWATAALTTLLVSGVCIFLPTPGKYLGSNPFRIKMALLCLAILFHFAVLRRIVRSEPDSRPRFTNLIIAGMSLTLWFSVGWAGRAIAFVP